MGKFFVVDISFAAAVFGLPAGRYALRVVLRDVDGTYIVLQYKCPQSYNYFFFRLAKVCQASGTRKTADTKIIRTY
jgi:hypothetical protein